MADASPTAVPLLQAEGVLLGCTAPDRDAAVRVAGQLLVDLGAVEPAYVDAMLEREALLSSFVGEGIAIPHGTDAARAFVRRPALTFLQFPDGLDWAGQPVHVAVGIAAAADEHVGIMSRLAQVLLDPDSLAVLRTTDDPQQVLDLLTD